MTQPIFEISGLEESLKGQLKKANDYDCVRKKCSMFSIFLGFEGESGLLGAGLLDVCRQRAHWAVDDGLLQPSRSDTGSDTSHEASECLD